MAIVRPPNAIRERGTGRRGVIVITGTILIGAAGAITTTVCELASVVKTAAKTGRYTVTFYRKYRNVRVNGLVTIGPADAALTSTDGIFLSARNVSGTSIDIQASQVSLADANPTNGNSIHFTIEAQEL